MKTIINNELCQNKNQRVIRSQKKSGQRNLSETPKSLEERAKQIRFLQGRGFDIELIT